MSVYLGYDEITKQYLKSLGGSGSRSSSVNPNTNGFTMSGDINMGGNEVIGLDDPSGDNSAASKKYVDDEVAKITTSGGLDQATADGRYLRKTDASSTCETKTDAFSTYLSKTDATNTYAPVDASYTKSESDNKYSLKGSGGGGGGLSASGFAMTGDIDMGNNKILKLADPITPKSATNKEYADNNFLSKHGGLILGNIAMSGQSITNLNPVPQNFNDAVTKKYVDDMGGYEIENMLRTPTTDLSTVTKKWVSDEFPTKQEVLGGFTLTGALNLSGNEIYGLPDTPTTDNSAASKKYVDSKVTGGARGTGLSDSGFTMKGDINMGGYEVIGVTSVPSFNNSLVNKKYVDDSIAAVNGGISQAQADARYVEKAKLTLGEWMDTFDEVNFVDYNWSKQVKKTTITSESNIEIRVASFVTDMSISQLLKHKLIIGIRYVDSSSTMAKHLVTIPLTGKSFSKLSYGASGDYGYMYSFHIHNGEYIGNDADAIGSYLWQVGAKFEAMKSHTLLDTSAHISFALNEAGQLG